MTGEYLFFNYLNLMVARLAFILKSNYFVQNLLHILSIINYLLYFEIWLLLKFYFKLLWLY
jgi:hypothetical protein